ncbi:hypothetical protein DFJ73DRAFT_518434 [Zopfochytrium polystomum]|nr:hypothetical protein DFJ73DRAFT_518434 [Zopfochytrium polystomum]
MPQAVDRVRATMLTAIAAASNRHALCSTAFARRPAFLAPIAPTIAHCRPVPPKTNAVRVNSTSTAAKSATRLAKKNATTLSSTAAPRSVKLTSEETAQLSAFAARAGLSALPLPTLLQALTHKSYRKSSGDVYGDRYCVVGPLIVLHLVVVRHISKPAMGLPFFFSL